MNQPLCTHCGRPVRPNPAHAIIDSETGGSHPYCDHRRACRRALHEALPHNPGYIRLPMTIDRVTDEALGAALIAFDYAPLPWWLRWIPDRWLDDYCSEVALQVGGAVEASLTMKGTQ
jgi:hypothetical protein